MTRLQRLRQYLLQPATANRRVHLLRFGVIAATTLVLAQLGSYLIHQSLGIGDSVVLIDGVLNLTHVRNLGGVFGLAQGKGWVFGLLSVALLGGLLFYLIASRQVRAYEFACFGFVAGGGASNILDRLIYGSVIDFIDIRGIPFWNYIFNTADVFIHMGLWPMLFIGLFWHGKQTAPEQR